MLYSLDSSTYRISKFKDIKNNNQTVVKEIDRERENTIKM